MLFRSQAAPQMPEGTYYVSPGSIGDNRTALALLEAIRQHRQQELDAAGVPKLTVTAAGGSVTVDAAAAEAAIFTLGGEQ